MFLSIIELTSISIYGKPMSLQPPDFLDMSTLCSEILSLLELWRTHRSDIYDILRDLLHKITMRMRIYVYPCFGSSVLRR